jgi:hypothetical protein
LAWTDFNVLVDFAPATVVGQNFNKPRQAAALGSIDRLEVCRAVPEENR